MRSPTARDLDTFVHKSECNLQHTINDICVRTVVAVVKAAIRCWSATVSGATGAGVRYCRAAEVEDFNSEDVGQLLSGCGPSSLASA